MQSLDWRVVSTGLRSNVIMKESIGHQSPIPETPSKYSMIRRKCCKTTFKCTKTSSEREGIRLKGTTGVLYCCVNRTWKFLDHSQWWGIFFGLRYWMFIDFLSKYFPPKKYARLIIISGLIQMSFSSFPKNIHSNDHTRTSIKLPTTPDAEDFVVKKKKCLRNFALEEDFFVFFCHRMSKTLSGLSFFMERSLKRNPLGHSAVVSLPQGLFCAYLSIINFYLNG